MPMGYALILTLLFALLYVPLALTDRKTLITRSLYVIVGMMLTLTLCALFKSFESHNDSRGNVNLQQGISIVIDTHKSMQLALRGFGLFLVILASGELIRLVLKRIAGSELLGPAILFLAGALLFEPYWAFGLAIAIGLAGIVVLGIWGRKHEEVSASSTSTSASAAIPTSHPTIPG